MDVESTLKDEYLRPIATTLVPGSIALAPYVKLLSRYISGVDAFLHEYPAAFVVIFVVFVVAAGLILEDLSSQIEVNCFDKPMRKKDSTHRKRWEDYLKLSLRDAVVGQQYLKTVLVRFKFELSMIPALIAFLIGITWLQATIPFLSNTGFAALVVFVVVVLAYVYYEARSSAQLLDDVRKQILLASTAAVGGSNEVDSLESRKRTVGGDNVTGSMRSNPWQSQSGSFGLVAKVDPRCRGWLVTKTRFHCVRGCYQHAAECPGYIAAHLIRKAAVARPWEHRSSRVAEAPSPRSQFRRARRRPGVTVTLRSSLSGCVGSEAGRFHSARPTRRCTRARSWFLMNRPRIF